MCRYLFSKMLLKNIAYKMMRLVLVIGFSVVFANAFAVTSDDVVSNSSQTTENSQPAKSLVLARRGGRGSASGVRRSRGRRRSPAIGRRRSKPSPSRHHRRRSKPSPSRHHRQHHRRHHDRRYRRWVPYHYGLIPLTAFILYYSAGRPVYSCQARYRGLDYIGTMSTGGPCYINVYGQIIGIPTFTIMVH